MKKLKQTKEKEVKVKGDMPCMDCDVKSNPIWFTDNVLWNEVVRADKFGSEKKKGEILCPICFIKRTEKKFGTQCWRLIPDYKLPSK